MHSHSICWLASSVGGILSETRLNDTVTTPKAPQFGEEETAYVCSRPCGMQPFLNDSRVAPMTCRSQTTGLDAKLYRAGF